MSILWDLTVKVEYFSPTGHHVTFTIINYSVFAQTVRGFYQCKILACLYRKKYHAQSVFSVRVNERHAPQALIKDCAEE